MAEPASGEITQLLRLWNDGDSAALEKLTPLVYRELHRLAVRYLANERPGHTLQATGLVNEAYVRILHEMIAASLSRSLVSCAICAGGSSASFCAASSSVCARSKFCAASVA